MKKLLLVGFCALLLCLTQAYAQNRTITGTVTAKDDGLPLAGVAVRVQGNQTGVATSVDGKFTIKVPSENSVLVFSYIGYVPQSIPVSGKLMLNVVLAPTLNELNEVVVTGVGAATEKRRVAIDVATVSNKDFAKSATTDVTQALTGQIAGAQIQSTSGQPGQAPLILLRGFTNLGTSQPLILVDGVQTNIDILTSLDPNIVDHIEVVKGSAGGMLYGSQGGNGVIQIFTKKGSQNGKLTIDFNTKASMDKALTGNRPLQAQYNHYVTNAGGQILDQNGNVLAQNADGTWPDPQIDVSGPNVVNNKPFNLPTYNHVDELYRTAYTFTNSLNMRGGTEKADYAFNLSNLQQQDVYSTNYNRTNLGANIGFMPVKGLTIRNNTQLIYTNNNTLGGVGTGFNGVMSYQFINLKTIDPQTGKYVIKPNDNIDGNNFIAERQWHDNNNKTPRILENIDVNYKLPKFLEFDYKYSLDYRHTDGDNYWQDQSNSGSTTFYGPSLQGAIYDTYTQLVTQYQNATLFFRTDFKNDFHINLPIKTITQVSYDATSNSERYYQLQGVSLAPYPPANIVGSSTKTGSDYSSSTLYYGYLVNQTIDFGNLFGVSGGFRSDYSSNFGGQSKPFTFPRGTVYFNPSELLKTSWLTNWKLRGAYGEAGVQPGVYDNQLALDNGQLGTSGVALSIDATAHNPLLRVQVTKELEIGTDVTITPTTGDWFSRISFAGSYWKRTSNDDEQTASVAFSTGYTGTLDNLVSLSSHGIDLSADFDTYKSNNFAWNLGLRFATARTMVTKISNGQPVVIGDFELAQGQQLGVFYGQTPLHSLTQTDHGTPYITAANQQFYTLVNGNVVDTRTNAPVLTSADDLSVIGNSNPKFTSSITNRFTIMKKLGVSFQVDWNYGANVYNQTRQWLYRDEVSKDFDQPVTIAGKTGAFVNYYEGFYNSLNPTSWFVESGSYARLRDASISYDLTSAVHQKWLRSLVITASGRNLLTVTKYHGLDPEATGATDSEGNGLGSIGQYRGVDYFGVPNLRSYQLSLNVGF